MIQAETPLGKSVLLDLPDETNHWRRQAVSPTAGGGVVEWKYVASEAFG
jgi:hypothetical protein